jgi:hypothetical protein
MCSCLVLTIFKHQDCDDSLSDASTKCNEPCSSKANTLVDHKQTATAAERQRTVNKRSRRPSSLNGSPISKRISPDQYLDTSSSQAFTNLPERIMSKLKLGDRALPKLTDTFPEPRSWSMSGRLSTNMSCKERGLSLATQCSRDSQEISWRDHSEESAWQDTIKAKYGSKTCAAS